MKTDKTFLLLTASALLLLISGGFAAADDTQFGGGDGSAASPYLINNASDFNAIRNDLSAHYRLNSSIDLTGIDFLPIGDQAAPFRGSLTGGMDENGDPFTISNFGYTGVYEIGLFGWAEDAAFSNLVLKNIDITGSYRAGALAGVIVNTTVTRCDVYNSIIHSGQSGLIGIAYDSTISDCLAVNVNHSGASAVGSILGHGNNTTITNCHSDGKVEGKQDVGGLVGSFSNGTIDSSSSSCTISMNTSYSTTPKEPLYIGGLVGVLTSSDIINSYVSGSVESVGDHSGGLVGRGFGSNITDSYMLGDVKSTGYYTGGLIGNLQGGNITRSYTEGDVDGTQFVGGLAGYFYQADLTDSYTIGSAVNGTQYTGGLAGYAYQADLTDSYTIGSTVNGTRYVGGLAGRLESGSTMAESFVTDSSVTGQSDVGGLIGFAYNLTEIYDSYAAGVTVVTGSGDRIGGLVGRTHQSVIGSSFMAGDVKGSTQVGGLVGTADVASVISDSYVTGDVEGGSFVGGLVGWFSAGSIQNSLALSEYVNGTSSVGRFYGSANSGTISDSFAWTNTSNAGTLFVDSAGNGTPLTSAEVWRIYPGAGWENWGSGSAWELNQYAGFMLPVHAWTDKNVAANASHLIPKYSITYDGNTCTSGTVPVDPAFYLNDVSFKTATILDAGDLEKENYIFAGWNTEADGSGGAYAADDTRLMDSNVTLYAQWTEYQPDSSGGGDDDDGDGDDGDDDGDNDSGSGNGGSGGSDGNSTVAIIDGSTGGDLIPLVPGSSMEGPDLSKPSEGFEDFGLVQASLEIVLLFFIAIAFFCFRRMSDEADAEDERFAGSVPFFG